MHNKYVCVNSFINRKINLFKIIVIKNLITIFFFIYVGVIHAQVGIGTPLPDASAQLDLVSSDKGFLVPRVSLTGSTDATTITNGNVSSLLVFNIATTSDVTPGYYYWDGIKWLRIASTDDLGLVETLTTLTDNLDDTFTYKSEDNTLTTFIGTDDQNLTGATLTGTSLQIDIENGTSQTVDLASIQDGTGTDNQNLTNASLVGNTLTIDIERGNSVSIDLSTLTTAQTITTLTQNTSTGVITYTNEQPVLNNANVISMDANNNVIVGSDGGAFLSDATLVGLEPWRNPNTSPATNVSTDINYMNGNIGIGINTATEMLEVAGNVFASGGGSFLTDTGIYADYVFEKYINGISTLNKEYTFKTLKEVDAFVKINKHLPGVTGIKELKKTETGYIINISALSGQLLEKVEELFLHTIEQQKIIEDLKEKSKAFELRLKKIEAALEKN